MHPAAQLLGEQGLDLGVVGRHSGNPRLSLILASREKGYTDSCPAGPPAHWPCGQPAGWSLHPVRAQSSIELLPSLRTARGGGSRVTPTSPC
jgi:hypothetical protein